MPSQTVEKNSTTHSKRLTDVQVRILSFIEQKFWETGYVPTDELVSEKLGVSVSSVKASWKNETFRHAIIARGIDIRPEESRDVLSPAQVLLANMLLNMFDKNSIREKLKVAGVTSSQYNAWMRQPAFKHYLRKRAEEAFEGTDPIAFGKLIELVEEKDFKAIQLFMEMRGIYNPKVQVDVNVEVIITRVVEVLSKHVDPEILALVADELEGIMPGEQGAPVEAMSTPIKPFSLMIGSDNAAR